MKTIAITGATGFLGKYLTYEATKMRGHRVIAIGHSESKVKDFELTFPDVPLYTLDIANDLESMKEIFKKHRVDTVIHSAAMKHVGICEKNARRAIEVNVIGCKNVITAAQNSSVNNCVLISTDKSIDPSCVYGMTKSLGERIFLESGYGVFQGVNFLYSTGSVLDIWEKHVRNGRKIAVNGDAVRFFALASDIAVKVMDNLETRGKFTVDSCHRIRISDLQKAFSSYWNYSNVENHSMLSIEKLEEALPDGIEINTPTVDEIVELITKHKYIEADIHSEETNMREKEK